MQALPRELLPQRARPPRLLLVRRLHVALLLALHLLQAEELLALELVELTLKETQAARDGSMREIAETAVLRRRAGDRCWIDGG